MVVRLGEVELGTQTPPHLSDVKAVR